MVPGPCQCRGWGVGPVGAFTRRPIQPSVRQVVNTRGSCVGLQGTYFCRLPPLVSDMGTWLPRKPGVWMPRQSTHTAFLCPDPAQWFPYGSVGRSH